MTENDDKKKKPLTLSKPGKLELKKTVEGGQVRQSFSHGRTKTVTVEVKKKRTFQQGATGEMTEIKQAAEEPVVEAPAAPAAPEVVPEAVTPPQRTLTDAEQASRVRALEAARKAAEEAAVESEKAKQALDEARQVAGEEEAVAAPEAPAAVPEAETPEAEPAPVETRTRREIEEEARREAEAQAQKMADEAAQRAAAAERKFAELERKTTNEDVIDEGVVEEGGAAAKGRPARAEGTSVPSRPSAAARSANASGRPVTTRVVARPRRSYAKSAFPTSSPLVSWAIAWLSAVRRSSRPS